MGKTLDDGFVGKDLPYAIFVVPPQEDTLTIANKTGRGFNVSWNDPADGIAGLLMNDLQSMDHQVREGIIHLVVWAYWTGVRETIEIFTGHGFPDLLATLEKIKKFEAEMIRASVDSMNQKGGGPTDSS